MNLKKLVLIIVPIGIGSMIAGGVLGVFYTRGNYVSQLENDNFDPSNINMDELHATISIDDMYDDLRIVNGEVLINDDFIAKILNKLIHEAHFVNSDGVKWAYRILSNQDILISIVWLEGINENKRNYRINIKKDEA